MTIKDSFNQRFIMGKRRKILVDIPIQLQVSFEIMVYSFVPLTMLIFMIYTEPFATMFSNQTLDVHRSAVEWLITINTPKWPIYLFAVVFLIILNLVFSHRIIGPYYKMSQVFKKYADRDLQEEFGLRKYDYYLPIVPVIRDFRNTLNEDLLSLAKDLKEIDEHASDSSKVKEIADRAGQRLNQYKLA